MHDGTGDNTGNIFPARDNGDPGVAQNTLLVQATSLASLTHPTGLDKNRQYRQLGTPAACLPVRISHQGAALPGSSGYSPARSGRQVKQSVNPVSADNRGSGNTGNRCRRRNGRIWILPTVQLVLVFNQGLLNKGARSADYLVIAHM
jgi:hypothetical protein